MKLRNFITDLVSVSSELITDRDNKYAVAIDYSETEN